ncbi:MAG: hypothetical protein DBW80_02435 [Bacteroidetes bacterium]|nr:MAG: hypothetical protein DBW80_02435 [Bacteroidota bacterium]
MAVIGSIRQRSGLLIGVIVVALVLFLVSDMFRNPMAPQEVIERDEDVVVFDGQKIPSREVDSLYTRAWNDIYFGSLSQSFLGQAPINDRQSARDFTLAMQLLFQQDIDALGGITFRSEEDLQAMITRDASASSFFANALFDSLGVRNNGQLDMDALVAFLNTAINPLPGESPNALATSIRHEMGNVRTINANLAILNAGLRSPSWMDSTFESLNSQQVSVDYWPIKNRGNSVTAIDSTSAAANFWQAYNMVSSRGISMYAQSLTHSKETIDSVKSVVLYEVSVNSSEQPLEVLDLSDSRLTSSKGGDFSPYKQSLRVVGETAVVGDNRSKAATAVQVQEVFGLSIWAESSSVSIDTMMEIIGDGSALNDAFVFAQNNRLITNDIPSLFQDAQVRSWAKTLNSSITYQALSPDSVPVLIVKNTNAVQPDFSVVSVVSAPYGLVSQTAVGEFNTAVDSMYAMLSSSWDVGASITSLQAIPDMSNISRGFSGINRPGLEQNKNLVDWIFSSEMGAIDTFVTSNEDGSRTCYFVRLNAITPSGIAQDVSTLLDPTRQIASQYISSRGSFSELLNAFESAGSLQSFLEVYGFQQDAKQAQVTMSQPQISRISNTKALRGMAGTALHLPIDEVALVESGFGDVALVRRTAEVSQGRLVTGLSNILAYDPVTTAPLWTPMMALEVNRYQNPSYSELMLDLFYALRTKEWSF